MLRHEARLRAFLARLAGPAAGDDLAQDTFLRAWQRADDYRGDGAYGAWLCRIGWRLFLDARRRDARRAAFAAHEPDPVSSAAPAEAGIDLQRILARLKPVESAALLLCEGHGWSHGEAADILNLPLGTLKSLVLRSKAKVQMMLAEDAAR